jgi:hypothetical protein
MWAARIFTYGQTDTIDIDGPVFAFLLTLAETILGQIFTQSIENILGPAN